MASNQRFGWIRGLLGFSQPEPAPMAAPKADQFSVDIPPELLQAMTGGGNIAARISREEALQVPAVLRGRNLIAGTLAGLPLRFHDAQGRIASPTSLLDQIDPDVTNVVTLAQTYEDLLFEGVAWWRVTHIGWHGFPDQAVHVPVGSVHVAGTGDLPSTMRITADIPFPVDGQVFIDGIPVPDDEIIRFDSPNPPLLRHTARAIRACLKLDQTAARYATEDLPLGYFTDLPGEMPLSPEESEAVLDEWEQKRKQRAWAYVGGLKAETLAFNAEQIQLADQRQHAVLEIARGMGIDPEDLGVSVTSRTYQNGESRKLALLDFTLDAFLKTVEQRLSMHDVSPRGYTARAELNGFLRSDSLTRMQVYEVGERVGAFTPEEVRELEGKPPLSSEQRSRVAPQQPAAQPAQEQTSVQEGAGMPERFSSGSGTEIQFDGPELVSTFRVNAEKRTISGLIVPWGKVADNGSAKWRFSENSLYWADESRVKLNLHHDSRQVIGKAVRIQNTSAGLDASFKIARGPEGDRALSFAEDGVLDAFSVEVYFEDVDGWQPDPSDRSVRLVNRGWLRGTALTGIPAFDDARVRAVAASLDNPKVKETAMTDVTTDVDVAATFEAKMGALAEKVTESHAELTKQLGESIGESISAGFKSALENISAPQDERGTVRAARYTVTREEPVYRFNGSGSSLVRDAWYACRERDNDSIERLRKYRVQQDEMAKLSAAHFAPQSTSTASEIIPPGYRPDLYVPQLSKGRPLVSLCSRGTIANATPFLVPQFGTATGVTANHTEGTNPSDGSLTFTEATVTPGAISGRLTLTREIVDSANPAIDQIALATMRESYEQQTEQKVFTELNNKATVTANVSLAALSGTTDVAISPARDLLARYPFARFAAPTGAAMSQLVTRNFANAKGTDGRPLLPSVGAQNTAGLGNAVNQGWFVDGLTFVPAWAMTENVGDDVGLIVNSADVWVWESPLLSFRYEEKAGPANIELNVFGYFATKVLRTAGVFALNAVA
jgi:HK97 family phage prohead protease